MTSFKMDFFLTDPIFNKSFAACIIWTSYTLLIVKVTNTNNKTNSKKWLEDKLHLRLNE